MQDPDQFSGVCFNTWVQPARSHLSHPYGHKEAGARQKGFLLTARLHCHNSLPKVPYMRGSMVCNHVFTEEGRKKLGDKWSCFRSLKNSWEVSVGCFRDVGNGLARKREEVGTAWVRGGVREIYNRKNGTV